MQMAQGHLLSTQRALGCHDILATIFSDVATLKNGWDAPFRKGDLVKLALVCRGWRVHTLRLVWRDLDSILPLWRLLAPSSLPAPTGGAPTDEYCDAVGDHTQLSECDNELNVLQIVSARLYLNETHLSKFLWYAGHVQELHARNSKDATLFRAILELNGGEPLFPSLQTLWWSPSTVSDLSLLPLFTSTLQNVILNYQTMVAPEPEVQDSTLCSILSHLHDTSPTLQYICIDANLESDPSPDLMRQLPAFRHLQRIYITFGIGSSCFFDLVSNGYLARAEVGYLYWDGSSAASIPPITAHALKMLIVTGNCECLTRLFTVLRAPNLEYAHLETSDRRAAIMPDYLSCINAFAAAVPGDALDWLHMELGFHDGPQSDTPVDLALLVEPLLRFRKLSYFYFASSLLDLYADDNTFVTITRAWKELEQFEIAGLLDWSTDHEHKEIPTAVVLHYFWRHCPRLRELALPHLEFQEILMDVDEERPSTHPLKHLRIDHDRSSRRGKIRLPEDMLEEHAHYVSTLFPALDAKGSMFGSERRGRGWGGVLVHLEEAANGPMKRLSFVESDSDDSGSSDGYGSYSDEEDTEAGDSDDSENEDGDSSDED
ncbi:hypothetical protein C8Q76DRAFT_697691 [Earliella scabrosa]|nr:hypothetical protein C8Q76DRAFT_697691 [Earliella scabrosa]